ncbi:unnamed protein product [Parnassius apollo]|uniref:(apollo) hypothetical protein n=1 Tax=Parnassius apollo TaxID=110799 RepID=A0A8S3WH22_PARAO|nr:unnamed protein product [Parnassius apollo]
MGSGASGFAAENPGTDLRLPTTGLRFTVNQLRSLNSYVDTLYEEDQKNRMSIEMECLVEGIVQRIVDGAGQKDPRFRCSHLIALHREKKMRSRSLEYIVTLDSLPVLNADSEDCRLQDGPVGYGKIRLTGREADKWSEFLTPSGYLCRDKVVERWVQAAARSARARGGGIERVHCARALIHARPYRYCYLQRVSPQTRTEHRLAIVEGAAWVMVRVGVGGAGGTGGGGGEVDAGSQGGGRRTRRLHRRRAPHAPAGSAALHRRSGGPPTSTACNERGVLWQFWHPSLEATLDSHCSDLSTVARVAGALNATIDHMREGSYQGSIRLLSRYMASCAFRARLLDCGSYDKCLARFCAHAHRSHHLLLTIDSAKMKLNDVILRLAIKDKRNIPVNYYQKIGGTNLQESREKSDFDIIDNLSETGKIDYDIPQCNLVRANQDFIAVPEAEKNKTRINSSKNTTEFETLLSPSEHFKSYPIEKVNFVLPNDLQTQCEKYDITISNSATYNTEMIPSTSSIEVKDQNTSNSTSNEDSDDSVKDPDFQIEERRSIKISDDSETEDNVGSQANFEATPAATSSVSTLYLGLDDTIPDTKKRSRKRVAKPIEWLQNKCKILRNAGSAYVTLKTKVKKDSRKIKPPCSERCRLKCKEKFSEADSEAVLKSSRNLKILTAKEILSTGILGQ